MKYADPFEIICPNCNTRQLHRVDDLRSMRAVCSNCGASLAEIGQKMAQLADEAGRKYDYILIPLTDIEIELGVPLPDNAGWDHIKTKADFVRTVAAYLSKVAPNKADCAIISMLFDKSLNRRGCLLPSSDSTPLY